MKSLTEKDQFFEEIRRNGGLPHATFLISTSDGLEPKRSWILEFIFRAEAEEKRAESEERRREAEQGLKAAVSAANASRLAALWTMVAAFATAIGAVGTMWQAYLAREQVNGPAATASSANQRAPIEATAGASQGTSTRSPSSPKHK